MTRNSHILLVEDDSALQALIEQLLIKNNYIVSRAGSIEEAKRMIKILSMPLYDMNEVEKKRLYDELENL